MAVSRTPADRLYAGLAPLVFAIVHGGARALGAEPAALRARRGFLPAVAGPCLWLHGASAGEMAAAANLVTLLRQRGAVFTAAYTTTNAAGLRLIGCRLAPGDVASLAPWDAPRWVARALERWQPAALALIETELWPALILAATERGVPVVVASARIYPRDLSRYRLARSLITPTLARVEAVLAQSETERARFLALGSPPGRCTVGGSLKHLSAPGGDRADGLRRAVGLAADECVWVVGSLHDDETEFVCAAIAHLPERLRRAVIAPRHAAAVRAFEAAARRRGWATARRSASPRSDWRVLLLDTMGELRAAYAGAAAAVVGGSFAAHGGHDLVEPVRCGAPVLFGPHTAHAEPEASALCGATPEALVRTPAELAARLVTWMTDAGERAAVVARQRAALPDPATIADRYVAAFGPHLPSP